MRWQYAILGLTAAAASALTLYSDPKPADAYPTQSCSVAIGKIRTNGLVLTGTGAIVGKTKRDHAYVAVLASDRWNSSGWRPDSVGAKHFSLTPARRYYYGKLQTVQVQESTSKPWKSTVDVRVYKTGEVKWRWAGGSREWIALTNTKCHRTVNQNRVFITGQHPSGGQQISLHLMASYLQ